MTGFYLKLLLKPGINTLLGRKLHPAFKGCFQEMSFNGIALERLENSWCLFWRAYTQKRQPCSAQWNTKESYTNCSWPRNSVLAVTIQLFNANKSFLVDPIAVIWLSGIKSQTMTHVYMYRCRGAEVQQIGNTAVLRPIHYLFFQAALAQ